MLNLEIYQVSNAHVLIYILYLSFLNRPRLQGFISCKTQNEHILGCVEHFQTAYMFMFNVSAYSEQDR